MYTAFLIFVGIAVCFQSLLLFLAFFGPELPYRIKRAIEVAPHSDDFLRLMEVMTGAKLALGNRIEVLANGVTFYEAELAAIEAAQSSVNLEAYIFERGEIAARYLDAMTRRARAGVRVNLVIDALGSLRTPTRYFRDLVAAGACVEWYHPIRWSQLPRLNNRTHREMLIVDGAIGFIGGAGIADQWFHGAAKEKPWRDTMFRVEGPSVTYLQSAFAENWLRTSGEILTGREYFPLLDECGNSPALVVNSTPAEGSTRARILYQVLIAAARESICITTPYFLPDRSARSELSKAIQRGVAVTILTPGQHSDHLLTRSSSRRLYGELLKAGAKIFEYQPAMIHAKIFVVDNIWNIVGSTNLDHRSFELNDEVNLAAYDADLSRRLIEDLRRDIAESTEVTYETWRKRSAFRFYEWLGWLIERQE